MSDLKIATRRDFLTRGLGLIGVGSALPNFLINSAMADAPARHTDRIVVSLLLTGGPDGLATVPPYAHEDYYRFRTSTRIDEAEVLKLNNEVGLHPVLRGFKDMFDDRAFAVVLGTGYPNYDLSHFTSRDYWEAAQSGMTTGRPGATGWLGRYIDQAFKGNRDPKLSVAVGPGRLPLIITGQEHPGLGFESPDSFRFAGARSRRGNLAYRDLNRPGANPRSGTLQFVQQTAVNANEASQQIRNILGDLEGGTRGQPGAQYPETQFGDSLRTIAALINKGLSARVYYAAQGMAQFGGYDTHAEQKPRHAALMTELCQSVCAFYRDLKAAGNHQRVFTFTFSEFGRRVRENYSQGTDHGLAQPMFLIGPMVKPGVHGIQPSFKDLDGNGNLKMQVDFRRVYAAILERWLGVPSQPILGGKFEQLDCMA